MIQNIKVNNVGTFFNLRTIGNFETRNIIFANNTHGKSTLTSIFRSMTINDPTLIELRKSLESKKEDDCFIEMSIKDGVKTVFQNNSWNNISLEFEIFDSAWVKQNVYSLDYIDYENHKNLHTLILGNAGQQFLEDIRELDGKISQSSLKQSEITKEINQTLLHYKIQKDSNWFVKLPNWSESLGKERNQIKSKTEQFIIIDTIKTYLTKQIDQLTKIIESFSTNRVVFQKTLINTNSAIEEHIKNHWKNSNENKNFLALGLELLKDDKKNCVFCGQELTIEAKNLLKNYESFL